MDIQGRKVDLDSGAVAYIIAPKYEDTEEFLSAFLESVSALPPNFETGDDAVVKMVSQIAISKAITSPKFKASMWKCLSYCLYVGKGKTAPEKISPSLFDTGGVRSDLPAIFYECAVENFSPFFVGLYNISNRLSEAIRSIQKPL